MFNIDILSDFVYWFIKLGLPTGVFFGFLAFSVIFLHVLWEKVPWQTTTKGVLAIFFVISMFCMLAFMLLIASIQWRDFLVDVMHWEWLLEDDSGHGCELEQLGQTITLFRYVR